MSDILVYSFLAKIAAELYTVPWGWIGLGVLAVCLVTAGVRVTINIWRWLKGPYSYWDIGMGYDRVIPNIWRWSKVRSGQTTTVPEEEEEEERIVTCGTIWVDRMYSERLKALSEDFQACLYGRADTTPLDDPDPWSTMKTRLEGMAAELSAQNIRYPPLPRADAIVLADVGRWRDYLAQLLPIAERGDFREAERTFGLATPRRKRVPGDDSPVP